MQKEITSPMDLLDENGYIIQSGWARKLLFNYEREKIKAGPLRIKEWDFWKVVNPEFCVVASSW